MSQYRRLLPASRIVATAAAAATFTLATAFSPQHTSAQPALARSALAHPTPARPALSRPASAQSAAAQQAEPDPKRWSSAIQSFEEWDRKNSHPKDALLFVGSSTIVNWHTAQSFREWPVINRGFGGSHLAEVTHYADQVVLPYAPRAIVLYAGDNDIAAGRSAEQVSNDFAAFVARVRAKLPQTPIVFLSIKPSGARWAHWPTMQDANRRIAEQCRRGEKLTFVDVGAALLNDRGVPRDELFLSDRLHLNADGYAACERVLRPVLGEVMK
ncbi:MAG: hypothetical protein CHACPFDD_02863 [Phycisphaerae bacterium]|nr:hypothetical protein [Phycisphaerae bacterium]